jgi:LuxR family transcriptional regulator, maltose regulon positive regulatory protein
MSALGTKLRLPSPRRRLVSRARITDQLRVGAGEAPRLLLVAAPAGLGKTTLLAQWLAAIAERGQTRAAWLAIDPADAELRVFLTDLVAAVLRPAAGVLQPPVSRPHRRRPDRPRHLDVA